VAAATAPLVLLSVLTLASATPAVAVAATPDVVRSRVDLVSAQLAARLQHSRVEVVDLGTPSSTTYANANGSLTVEATAGPTQVRDGDEWVPIDSSLVSDARGLHARKPAIEVAFGRGGGSTVASAARDGATFGLNWTAKLPAPTISGDTATYTNVRPGVDLLLTSQPAGFEISAVLRQRPSSPVSPLRLPLAGTGLNAVSSTGGVELRATSGRTVASISTPVMFGFETDASGQPTRTATVGMTVDTAPSGTQTLVLTPDNDFLNDPAVTYPVTLDPAFSFAPSQSSYIDSSASNTNFSSSSVLATGNAISQIRRALLGFDVSSISANAQISTASLVLTRADANRCTTASSALEVRGVTSAWTASTVAWSGQPSYDSNAVSSSTNSSTTSCGPATTSFPVTSLVQAWVAQTRSNYGLVVKQAIEPCFSACDWRTFNSPNATTGQPVLSITYSGAPNVPSALAISPSTSTSGVLYTNSRTPVLSAVVSDPDGGTVNATFTVRQPGTNSVMASGIATNVASGSRASWTVPSNILMGTGLTDNAFYFDVSASDGTTTGSLSTAFNFTVDATAPAAPTLTSNEWAQGSWTTTTTGTFRIDTGVWREGYRSYNYWLDDATPATLVNPYEPTYATLSNVAAGLHYFHVQSFDRAGNYSTTTNYKFGIGYGQLTTPTDQQTSEGGATLTSVPPSNQPYVAYSYRRGTTGTFLPIPVADVTNAGTTTHPSSWPVAFSASPPGHTWDLATTVHTAGGTDGPVQVQACFYATTTDANPQCSPINTVQYTSHGFTAAGSTNPIGPGRVSLTTGDYSVDASDVSAATWIGSLSVGRTLTTLTPPAANTGATGVFGAGWTASMLGADAGDADMVVTDNSSTADRAITLTATDGTQYNYVTQDWGDYPFTFQPMGDARDGSYVQKLSATQIARNDADGTVTNWNLVGGVWQVASVSQTHSGSNDLSTTFTMDAQHRVTQITAPGPYGLSCAPLQPGCRALTVTYASATTATGITSSTWGDYTGLVKSIALVAADPATGSMVTTDVANYSYDNSGHLRAEWDPRISPALKTTYSYDGNGRLATLTPPGLANWSFTYDSTGRILQITRPDPANGTATQTIVYGVPFTGSSAPVELGVAATSTWNESTDLPASAVAVFNADHIPAGTTISTVAAADWPYASVHYLDANGREVNNAAYGAGAWQIETSQYDKYGNVISSLSAGRRLEALSPTSDTDPYVAATTSSVTRAQLLSTLNTYSTDGTMLTDTLGPTRPVQLDDNTTGVTVSARPHTVMRYDEGAPTSIAPPGGFRLPTTVITYAKTLPDGVDHDPKYTSYVYAGSDATYLGIGLGLGWTLRKPITTFTTMPDGNDLWTTNEYNESGQLIATRLPSDAKNVYSGGADTTYQIYFGQPLNAFPANIISDCSNTADTYRIAMRGFLCETTPASDYNGGGFSAPLTKITYNRLGLPLTSTKQDFSTGKSITTTYTYDTAGRPLTHAYADSPAGSGGISLPTATYSYDANTGLATTASAGGATVTTGYDVLGRVTSYTDANAVTSTTQYDIDGRPVSTYDGKATTAYTYDSSTEHRGLVTALDVGIAGSPSTFTATYDAGGRMTSQTYPNGLVATTRYDDGDQPTQLTYARSGVTWGTFTETSSVTGQARRDVTPGGRLDYQYDAAGRLTTVNDTTTAAGVTTCLARVYGYDVNSNRTSQKSYPDDNTQPTTGHCTTATTPTTTNRTYNSYDQLTSAGYVYDSFGRTTTVPSVDVGLGGDMALTYFVNDLAASQTQNGRTKSWTLDPLERVSTDTDTLGGLSSTNHYEGTGDSPSWVAKSDGTWKRYIAGIDGNLAIVQSDAGVPQLQLTNLHSDVVATADDTTAAVGANSFGEFTEFGGARTAAGLKYGWLGGKQRNADSLAGVVLMGVRLYSPVLGRFLQADPVAGGSANNYDYADQDPLNQTDLSGRALDPSETYQGRRVPYSAGCPGQTHWQGGYCQAGAPKGISWKKVGSVVQVVATVCSFVPGGVGTACGVVSATITCANAGWTSGDCAAAFVSAVVGYGAGKVIKGKWYAAVSNQGKDALKKNGVRVINYTSTYLGNAAGAAASSGICATKPRACN
jgi:RHS repeat-associated protein